MHNIYTLAPGVVVLYNPAMSELVPPPIAPDPSILIRDESRRVDVQGKFVGLHLLDEKDFPDYFKNLERQLQPGSTIIFLGLQGFFRDGSHVYEHTEKDGVHEFYVPLIGDFIATLDGVAHDLCGHFKDSFRFNYPHQELIEDADGELALRLVDVDGNELILKACHIPPGMLHGTSSKNDEPVIWLAVKILRN
jgi:hypothetical protein